MFLNNLIFLLTNLYVRANAQICFLVLNNINMKIKQSRIIEQGSLRSSLFIKFISLSPILSSLPSVEMSASPNVSL